MNALVYAINEIKSKIPFEVLHAGLMFDEQEVTANLTSLDDKILRKVLRKRVLIDANIVGGVETIIPLNNINPSFSEYFYTVYSIPPESVMNREIISALSLSYLPVNSSAGQLGGFYGMNGAQGNNGMIPGQGGNSLMSVANRIGNAASSTGVLSNAHIEIVAYNTLLIYANYRALTNFGVRVVLENDNNLNNIQPRSYKQLGMLCALGVKAYLYNKLIVPINNGYLSGGQDLGMFKSVLESYSTAEEDYDVYLREIWGKIAFINDVQRYNRFLGGMLQPDL